MNIVSEMLKENANNFGGKGRWEGRLSRVNVWILSAMGVLLTFSAIIGFISSAFSFGLGRLIATWGLIVVDVFAGFLFIFQLAEAGVTYFERPPVKGGIFELGIRCEIGNCSKHIEDLMIFKKINLKYVSDQILRQQEILDRTRHLWSGVVEKVGIAPLIVTMLIASSHILSSAREWRFGKMPEHALLPFGWFLILGVSAIYVVALLSLRDRFKWERVLWIVAWAAENADDE